MRRLAEGAAKLTAEVRAREAGGAGEILDAERLAVAAVGQVFGAQQVADGRDEEHRSVSVRRGILRKLIAGGDSAPRRKPR